MANTTPIVTTVTKTTTKEKAPKETDAAPKVNIQDFCEEHYEDILPVIKDKLNTTGFTPLTGPSNMALSLALGGLYDNAMYQIQYEPQLQEDNLETHL
ncbi:hypothetical protein Tco_1231018 [Tanacetum coccineum]